MGKVEDINFYSTFGWMKNHLDIKGYDLILYSIIWGFTQNGSEQKYNGSLGYLCEWTGLDKANVCKRLKSMTERGLLSKTVKTVNGVTFCEYVAIVPDCAKNNGVAVAQRGCCGSANNNKENNKVSKDKSLDTKPAKTEKFKKPTIEEISQYCLEHNITGIDPEYFFNYYEANGWVQGKGKPIKSWTACLNTWKRNNFSCAAPAPAPEKPKTLKTRIDENGQEVAYYE